MSSGFTHSNKGQSVRGSAGSARNRVSVFVLLVVTLGLVSCRSVVDSSVTSDYTNPDNPYFINPGVTFSLSFVPGDTLTTNRPTIAWTGSVFDSCEFTWTVDSIMFGGWSTDSSVTVPHLDEGRHLFEIRTRYLNGVEVDTSTTLEFYVNALPGPGLRISPPYQELPANERYELDVSLEEVTNWSGGRISVRWDADQTRIRSYYLLLGADALLNQHQSQIISDFDIFPDSLVLDLGLVDDLVYGINGSGPILHLSFQPLSQADCDRTGLHGAHDLPSS